MKIRGSVVTNLTIKLGIVILIVALISLMVVYFTNAHMVKIEIEDEANKYTELLEGGLEIPLWNLDKETIESIALSYFQNDLIGEIKIVDSWGQVYFDKSDEMKDFILTEEIQIFHKEQEIGKVKFSFSRDYFVFYKRYATLWSLAVLSINIFIFVILLRFILKRDLVKPLLVLAEGVEMFAKGDLTKKIIIKRNDEIGMLAEVFNEMTKKLAAREKKLKQTMKKLKELDELKDDFLNVATHELKTPLIPIKSQVELLLDGDYGKLNEEQKDAIEMISRNEEHLNSLVSDVLDITKIKSKKLKLISEKVDLAKIIDEVVRNAKVVAKEKKINLKVGVTPQLPQAILDSRCISQVMGNLLDNAIKFTPKNGEIKIEIKKDKKNLVISIKDTGIGMNKKTLGKLFTPFFQGDADITRKYGGTGLGLSICKGIIEAHGGKIWAKSSGLNKGSVFSFSLPIKNK